MTKDVPVAPSQSSVDETQTDDRLDLVLASKRRGPDDDRYTWPPFEHDDRFNPDWWEAGYLFGDDNISVQVWQDGVEVARVLLDEVVGISHYDGAPPLGRVALKIQFFEVAADRRRRGIASEVVRLLQDAHPARRLVAFSEGADEVLGLAGWDRYEHREDPRHCRPLFVAARCRWCGGCGSHIVPMTPREGNQGERLTAARLPSGVLV